MCSLSVLRCKRPPSQNSSMQKQPRRNESVPGIAAERLRRAFSAQERPELFAPDEAACMLRLPDTGWTVSAAHAPELDVFLPLPMLDRLGSADRPGLLPRFSGTLRYERSFRLEALPEQHVFLELGRAY